MSVVGGFAFHEPVLKEELRAGLSEGCMSVEQEGNLDFTSVLCHHPAPGSGCCALTLEFSAVHVFLRSHLAKLALKINFFPVSFNIKTSLFALKSGCKT